MNKEEFKEKLKKGVDKVVNSSKKAIGKAGVAMQDFSDKSVIKIEKHQLESKRDVEYAKLGKIVANKFENDLSLSINGEEPEVSEIIKTINNFNKEIELKEKALLDENNKKDDTK